MAVTQTYTTTIKGSLGTLNPPAVVISGDEEVVISDSAGANAELVEAAAIDKDTLVAMYLWSDQDIDVTTNAGGDDSFTLEANVPYWWHTGKGTNPITVDITELHFDNTANDVAASVKAEFLLAVTA